MPDKPPMVNIPKKATANFIDVVKSIDPCHIVASQLKIFTPVGTAITKVINMNVAWARGSIPTVNMWCAHTRQPSTAIPIIAHTMLA